MPFVAVPTRNIGMPEIRVRNGVAGGDGLSHLAKRAGCATVDGETVGEHALVRLPSMLHDLAAPLGHPRKHKALDGDSDAAAV